MGRKVWASTYLASVRILLEILTTAGLVGLLLLMCYAQRLAFLHSAEAIGTSLAATVTELLAPPSDTIVVVLDRILPARTWVEGL